MAITFAAAMSAMTAARGLAEVVPALNKAARRYSSQISAQDEHQVKRLHDQLVVREVFHGHDENLRAVLRSLDAFLEEAIRIRSEMHDERLRILVAAMRDVVRKFAYRWHPVIKPGTMGDALRELSYARRDVGLLWDGVRAISRTHSNLELEDDPFKSLR